MSACEKAGAWRQAQRLAEICGARRVEMDTFTLNAAAGLGPRAFLISGDVIDLVGSSPD